ncbi:hypothetical protein BDZ94DRAFT_965167 [Collybia nuda]|uniref:Uncharacterized protein n=1 Tax=Collybia nuda TaxID=64659 RepID=A0A9P5YES0_9AGAR|nr:hypothetical protein BDZ94DRAFT_965167 [Collybia nuda]
MTDLTVLVSPMPLYPTMKQGFIFGRRESRPVSRPIMVTLETEIDPDESTRADRAQSSDQSRPQTPSTPRRSRSPRFDSSLLSPPINTWKSKPQRPRHRPTRSQSAPPSRTPPKDLKAGIIEGPDVAADLALSVLATPRSRSTRNLTAFPTGPTTQGGELLPPPPPLLRPTTFWRKTRKSGVTGPSYSPSSHLIRRSTYIAAGLTFDAPIHDLSAFSVESRVGFIVVPPDSGL